eukprot:Nk52_evm15s348 gene=Nk52_evmTU15s348
MSFRSLACVSVGLVLVLCAFSHIEAKSSMAPSLYEELVSSHNDEHPLFKYMDKYEKYYRENVLGRRDDDDERDERTSVGDAPGADGRPTKDDSNKQQFESGQVNVNDPKLNQDDMNKDVANAGKAGSTEEGKKYVKGEAAFRDEEKSLLRYKICRDGPWDYPKIVGDQVVRTKLVKSKTYEYMMKSDKDKDDNFTPVTVDEPKGYKEAKDKESSAEKNKLSFKEFIRNQVCFGDAFRAPAADAKSNVVSYAWSPTQYTETKEGVPTKQFTADGSLVGPSGLHSLLWTRMSEFFKEGDKATEAQKAFLKVFDVPVPEKNKEKKEGLGLGCIDALESIQKLVEPKGHPDDEEGKKSPGGWVNIPDTPPENKQLKTRLTKCAYFFYRMEIYGYLSDVTCGCEVMADVCDEQLWGMAEQTLSDVCFPPFKPTPDGTSKSIFCPASIYSPLYQKATLEAADELYADNPFSDFEGAADSIAKATSDMLKKEKDLVNVIQAEQKILKDKQKITQCAMIDGSQNVFVDPKYNTFDGVDITQVDQFRAWVGWYAKTGTDEGKRQHEQVDVTRVRGGNKDQTLTCDFEYPENNAKRTDGKDTYLDTCYGDPIRYKMNQMEKPDLKCYIERVVKIPGLCLCQKEGHTNEWEQGDPLFHDLVTILQAMFDRSNPSHSCCNCGDEIKQAAEALEDMNTQEETPKTR